MTPSKAAGPGKSPNATGITKVKKEKETSAKSVATKKAPVKTTTAGKAAKPARTEGKIKKQKKISVNASAPGEDEIRTLAQEIYNKRVAAGEAGTAEGDWAKAEAALRKIRE